MAGAMHAVSQQDIEKIEKTKKLEAKWTAPLLAPGWAVIPSVILHRQQALELDAVDINIIMHLIRHWWDAERLPFPSKRTIAECMGISESTVQRHIAKMEKRGLVQRNYRGNYFGGQTSNEYDLRGLIKKSTPLAKEAIKEKDERAKENAKRRIRKLPMQLVRTKDYSANSGK